MTKDPAEDSSETLEDFNEETVINENKTQLVQMQSFQDFNLNEILLLNIRNAQFENPSPVQGISIPKVLLGRDILCQAKSGTGKTAVFVIGTIERFLRRKRSEKIPVVVCCPTEELAYQIFLEYKRFCKNLKIKISQETVNSDFLIGTPDKLLMIFSEEKVKGDILVVDECDLIIDDHKFRKLIKKISPDNTLMFTATLTKETKQKCLEMLKDPFEVYVNDDTQLTLYGLKQFFVEVKESEKINLLMKILEKNFKKVIIFCKRVQNAKYVPTVVKSSRYLTDYENSSQRIKILNAFRSGFFSVLCTTDILSRGIDVNEVDLVINFDIPENPQTYLHRVGRTGRFETGGLAVNFVNGIADKMRLNEVKIRYEIDIKELKDVTELSS